MKWLVGLCDGITRSNPKTLARLAAAATRNELYHEVPLRYTESDGSVVEGIVDLLWREDDGWHLLDYKAGTNHPHGTGDEPLQFENLRHHYAQISLYAEGLKELLTEPLVDIGIWYVLPGLVVLWDVE